MFEEPKLLLPFRAINHEIQLCPNVVPVNVRPYRYPHFQKGEIKKMISYMLSSGIIRPTTSTFSSPFLFVKKNGTW